MSPLLQSFGPVVSVILHGTATAATKLMALRPIHNLQRALQDKTAIARFFPGVRADLRPENPRRFGRALAVRNRVGWRNAQGSVCVLLLDLTSESHPQ